MRTTIFLTSFILLFQSLNGQKYLYEIPKPSKDWNTENIHSTGIKAESLFKLMDKIEDKTYNKVHSILIIKNGNLVFEEYFGGYDWSYNTPDLNGAYVDYDNNSLHELHSVTKALTSIVVGIAIDKGFIKSEKELIFSYFPEYKYLKDSLKGKITLEHLLTFTSGLKWNELEEPLVGNPNNDLVKLMGKIVGDSTSMSIKNKVEFVLSKPQIAEPGTRWYYSGGDLIVLSEIIRKATGMRIDYFAEEYLFKPLEIRKYDMTLIDKDLIYPSGGLRLRPRDLAKIGYLFLNKGQWKGNQVISTEWLNKTTEGFIDIPFVTGGWGKLRYGYQWVQREAKIQNETINYFFRPGMGGNCVAVFPKYNVVFVMTAGFWPSDGPVNEIMDTYILPSIMTDLK
jgi:CubicO group peptidase (beta-lactamase class C family)